MSIRITLVVLAALVALPLAPTVSPVEAKRRLGTVSRTFANGGVITLPVSASSPVSASDRYPSAIAVDGLKKGQIRDVNVRLNDVQHPFPGDVQVLLVGPQGQTVILMAGSENGFDVGGVSLTFDDEATAPLPTLQQLQSGTFRPTNPGNEGIEFNAPAPVTSANASLSVLDGGNPNGTWRLFVQDMIADVDGGAFAGGWALEIEAKVKRTKKRQAGRR